MQINLFIYLQHVSAYLLKLLEIASIALSPGIGSSGFKLVKIVNLLFRILHCW